MVNGRDFEVLNAILTEIETLEKFVDGMSIEDFLSNYLCQYATGMALINIGEYTKKLSIEFRRTNKQTIPFDDIIGMRNHAAHEYSGLHFEDVWTTITEHIPLLKEQITRLLR